MTGEGSLFDVPPAAIGRFRVLHQVGAGACGPVFRGTDPDSGQPVAIKLFTHNLTPATATSLADALRALITRTPPLATAARPIDAGLHQATPYLVTSFAPGDSLDVALKQFGPAALPDLVPRLRLLAGALDAAAAAGLHHGALHPRDVIVSDVETAMTGLGVWPALVAAGLRLPRRNPYRAPELGDTTITAAGDQFALAALAYEWMTGRRAPSAFVTGDMAPVPGADREAMAGIFASALHADPAERFPRCGAFIDALAEVDVAPPPDDVPVPRGNGAGKRRDLPLLTLDTFPEEASSTPAAPTARDTAADLDLALHDFAAEDHSARHDDVMPEVPPPAVAHEVSGPAWDVPSESVSAPAPPAREDAAAPRLEIGPPVRRSSPLPVVMLVVGLIAGLGLGYMLWGRRAWAGPDPASFSASAPVPASEPVAAPPTAVPPSAGPARPNPDAPAIAAEPAIQSSPLTSGGATGSGGAVSAPPATPPPARADTSPAALPTPAPVAGSLLVRSTPAGATVFVDGERKGVTPMTVGDLALGARRLRVQRDGFAIDDRTVTLTGERPSRTIDVRLERRAAPAPAAAAPAAAKTGTLVIDSRPAGATVLVNGRPAGVTPVTMNDLAPGEYAVEMRMPGFRTLTTTVRVVAGERARAAASLTRAQEP